MFNWILAKIQGSYPLQFKDESHMLPSLPFSYLNNHFYPSFANWLFTARRLVNSHLNQNNNMVPVWWWTNFAFTLWIIQREKVVIKFGILSFSENLCACKQCYSLLLIDPNPEFKGRVLVFQSFQLNCNKHLPAIYSTVALLDIYIIITLCAHRGSLI